MLEKNGAKTERKKKLKYDRKKKMYNNNLYTSVHLENDGGDDDLVAAKYNVHIIVNTYIYIYVCTQYAYHDDDDLPPLRPPKRDQTRNRKYAQCNKITI